MPCALVCELLVRHRFHNQAMATPIVFEFIEGWYNTQRRHSSIGYLSPVEFERRHEGRLRESTLENGFQRCPQNEHHAPA